MALFGLPLSGVESALTSTLPGLMRGTGPSAARGQLYEGLGQAQRNAASLAASDRSNPALAMRNALLANQEMAQRTNQQAATLRAQEQLSSMGLGAQVGQALSQGLLGQLGAVGQGLVGAGLGNANAPMNPQEPIDYKTALLGKTKPAEGQQEGAPELQGMTPAQKLGMGNAGRAVRGAGSRGANVFMPNPFNAQTMAQGPENEFDRAVQAGQGVRLPEFTPPPSPGVMGVNNATPTLRMGARQALLRQPTATVPRVPVAPPISLQQVPSMRLQFPGTQPDAELDSYLYDPTGGY